jgi:hypothetical protein
MSYLSITILLNQSFVRQNRLYFYLIGNVCVKTILQKFKLHLRLKVWLRTYLGNRLFPFAFGNYYSALGYCICIK